MRRKKPGPEPSAPPPPPTLRHLRVLARYQATRHPRLADLCEREAAAALPREALAASKKRADVERWAAVDAAGDPLDSPRLGAAVRGGQQPEVMRQIAALVRRDDPTLAASLLSLLADPPYAGLASVKLVDAMLAALEGTRDRRAADAARALGARYLSIVNSGTGRAISARLGAIADVLAAVAIVELDADDRALCDEIAGERGETAPPTREAVATKRTLGDLLAEIYAAPTDDGPRQVFADLLIEAGDPRGPWMAAALARAAPLPVDFGSLLTWAHPLSTVGDVEFSRGFPTKIRIQRDAGSLAGHPAWSTIERIDNIAVVPQAAALAILDAPAAAGVRAVSTLSPMLIAKLGPRPWTHVGFESARPPAATQFASFPALASVAIAITNAAFPIDVIACCGPHVREARLKGSFWQLEVPPALARLELQTGNMPVLVGLATSTLRELELQLPRYRDAPAPAQLALPASLEALALSAGSMPELVLQRSLDRVRLEIATPLDARAFAALAGTRSLHFVTYGDQLPPESLARLPSLRELTASRVAATDFAALRELVSLTVYAAPDGDVRLDGLPLEQLSWTRLPISAVPALPRLRTAALAITSNAATFDDFLDRMPELRTLQLHGTFEPASPKEIAWRVAASALDRFTYVCRSRTFDIVRDGEGAMRLVTRAEPDATDDAIRAALLDYR